MLEKMDRWLAGVSKAERIFLEHCVKLTSRIMNELKVRPYILLCTEIWLIDLSLSRIRTLNCILGLRATMTCGGKSIAV